MCPDTQELTRALPKFLGKAEIRMMHKLRNSHGMTMIEMIGVLGVIAVLAAMIIPRIFDVITDSKIDALATATHTYEIGITKYYSDVGSLLPLDGQGIPQVEGTGNSAVLTSLASRLTLGSTDPLVLGTNLWPKFQGPYLEKFNTTLPPEIGTKMFLPTSIPVPIATPVTPTNIGWDLKGNDGNSDIPTDAHVAYFKLEGIGEEDFLNLDKVVDPLIGTTDAERKLRGRAKWNAANNGTLLLYMAHR
jgi:general secretion pathway protein G